MIDPYQKTADDLGVSSRAAKEINFMTLYSSEKINVAGRDFVLISSAVFDRIEKAALIAAMNIRDPAPVRSKQLEKLVDRNKGEGVDQFGCLMAINRLLNDGIPIVDVKDET